MSPEDRRNAAALLAAGGVVAFPTDTVYGVGASLTHPDAVQRLFGVKGRTQTKAIAVLVSDVDQAEQLGELGDEGRRLASRFWPGPLTLVVRRRPPSTDAVADLGGDPATIGLRCPADDDLRWICAEVGPLATTSANPSGEPTPVDGAGVRAAIGDRVDLVVDGSATDSAVASTVVSLLDVVEVLREGPISVAMLRAGDGSNA